MPKPGANTMPVTPDNAPAPSDVAMTNPSDACVPGEPAHSELPITRVDAASVDELDILDLKRGTILVFPEGWKPTQHTTKRRGTSYSAAIRRLRRSKRTPNHGAPTCQ